MSKILLFACGAVFTSIVTIVWWLRLPYGCAYQSMLNCAVAMLLVVSAATCWSIFMDALKEYLDEQNIPD